MTTYTHNSISIFIMEFKRNNHSMECNKGTKKYLYSSKVNRLSSSIIKHRKIHEKKSHKVCFLSEF